MNVAIIPAAGSGKRFGGSVSKQFLELSGTPVIFHTINKFEACPDIDAIAIAVPVADLVEFGEELSQRNISKPYHLVPGGRERCDSILNALEAIEGLAPEIVVVHDAVRPFVTPEQISEVTLRAKETGAALLALPAVDTIKEVENGVVVRTIDRRRIYRAQTPQAFRYELLMRANREAREAGIPSELMTDDSLLVERIGAKVAIVIGSPENIKITNPEDLKFAEGILSSN